MVVDALRLRWRDPDATRNGRRGQRQNGVDIFGHLGSSRAVVGAQCKNVSHLDIGQVVDEVSKAEKFVPLLEAFYFVVSVSRDAVFEQAVRSLSDSRTAAGLFRVEPLFFEDICSELANNPALVEKHWPGWGNPESGLEIVDITVADEQPHTVVDFKLRNTGRRVGYIRRVDFHVDNLGVIETHVRGYRQQLITATYDIEVDPSIPAPYTYSWDISQVVDGNDTDRFELRISYDPAFNSVGARDVIVQGRFAFAYNSAGSLLCSESLLFTIPPPRIILGERVVPDPEQVAREQRNRDTYRRMLALAGKPSPKIERLRDILKRNVLGAHEGVREPRACPDST